MLKNQGFIYLTPSSLPHAPVLKIGHYAGEVLPPQFEKQHQLLAVWSVPRVTEQVVALHTHLVRTGLAFTLPQVYQSGLAQMVTFIDSWLEIDRHLEASCEHSFEMQDSPPHSKYVAESSIDLHQLGQAWLLAGNEFDTIASSAFYRGMLTGQTQCQLALARCYEEGRGVEVDFMRARELLSALSGLTGYPHLLHLSYSEKKPERAIQIKDQFFSRAPLPLPGKSPGVFVQSLLDMLEVSFEKEGKLDFWFSSWELIYPYRDELIALATSQNENLCAKLKETFQSYRQSA